MWKALTVDNYVYLFKIDEKNGDYEIYFTNLSEMWTCQLSKELLSAKFQECNPLIDVKNEDALLQSIKLLTEIETAEVIINCIDSSTTKLSIKTDLNDFQDAKFKITYELELKKSVNDRLTNILTVPLLKTVILLEKQQNMLKNLLIKKDRELEEYQLEKGVISRSDLITDRFDPNTLITSSNNLILNTLDKIEDNIALKYGEIEEKVTMIEIESWNTTKKKRKIYNKETAEKAKSTKIVYKSDKSL